MNGRAILIVLIVLLLLGILPAWSWGGPSFGGYYGGGIGLVVLILVILLLLGKI